MSGSESLVVAQRGAETEIALETMAALGGCLAFSSTVPYQS